MLKISIFIYSDVETLHGNRSVFSRMNREERGKEKGVRPSAAYRYQEILPNPFS